MGLLRTKLKLLNLIVLPWVSLFRAYGSPVIWEGRHSFFQASYASLSHSGKTGSFANDTSRTIPTQQNNEGSEIFLPLDAQHMVVLSFEPSTRTKHNSGVQASLLPLVEEFGYRFSFAQTVWSSEENRKDFSFSEYSVRRLTGSYGMEAVARSLWYCDDVTIEMHAVQGGESVPATFHAENVLLGAFLTDNYDPCKVKIQYACSGHSDRCELRHGEVNCIPTNSHRADAAELLSTHCRRSEPLAATELREGSVRWLGHYAFLQASESKVILPDGNRFDMTEEPKYIYTGLEGEVFDVAWTNERGHFNRQLHLSALYSKDQRLLSPDAPGWGLQKAFFFDLRFRKLLMSNTEADSAHALRDHGAALGGTFSTVAVPAEYDAFYCKYAHIILRARSGSDHPAQWIAEDLIFGSHLPDSYDICSLRVFNPCHEGGTCHLVGGNFTCIDHSDPRQHRNPTIQCHRPHSAVPEYLLDIVNRASPVQAKERSSYVYIKSMSIERSGNLSSIHVQNVASIGSNGSTVEVPLLKSTEGSTTLSISTDRHGVDQLWASTNVQLVDSTGLESKTYSTQIVTPEGYDRNIFFCDEIILSFHVNSPSLLAIPETQNIFVAHGFFLSENMEMGVDLCNLKVFNPCQKRYCRIIDSQTQCLDRQNRTSIELLPCESDSNEND